MGYTHYWRRPKELDGEEFEAVVNDFEKVVPYLDRMGVDLADRDGTGEPVIDDDEIRFNGDSDCGHEARDLGITWPSEHPSGVNDGGGRDGTWFAGATLNTRACGGRCSHESFNLPRVYEPRQYPGGEVEEPKEDGLYFDFCKTAYKPYDLAVIAALTIAKHHLGDSIKVSSDGDTDQWTDGLWLCQQVLGYGGDMEFNDDGRLVEPVYLGA